MARIFILGASGYIGGQALYQIKNSSLRDTSIACLNRNPEKAEQIREAYPDVEIVNGDLDQTEIIRKEAEKADVVLHLASTKHVASAKAIVAGLTSPSRSSKTKGAWIQISGASLYAANEISQGRFGEASDVVHSDKSDISSIISLIQESSTREIEQIAIAQKPSDLRTALLVGPLFYGPGQGPCHKRSIQAPEIARATIKLGHGIRLLEGKNAWSNVHIADLGSLMYLLTEAALADKDVGWNEEGIYHPENGVMSFGELDRLIAQEAAKQNLIESSELVEISVKEAEEIGAHMSIYWGTNAVIKSQRAQASLGWKPEGPPLKDLIPELVRREGQAVKG